MFGFVSYVFLSLSCNDVLFFVVLLQLFYLCVGDSDGQCIFDKKETTNHIIISCKTEVIRIIVTIGLSKLQTLTRFIMLLIRVLFHPL